jgi:hypothetical protein
MTALRSSDVVSNVLWTGDEEQSASLDEWELPFDNRLSFSDTRHPVWRIVTPFSLLLLMQMASASS